MGSDKSMIRMQDHRRISARGGLGALRWRFATDDKPLQQRCLTPIPNNNPFLIITIYLGREAVVV
ncbi:hypothetical protein EJB05_26262 [Eragrostis curvula]|uniref:Uncharacterized protein n=1 Tax=Eragrostis curvula TaxID=38414 RepID=A0A5J9UKT8_9POAL|nr:hypothetical protein EJB05_26262 [Eragrostis curvula]